MIKRRQVTPVNYNNDFWKLLNELLIIRGVITEKDKSMMQSRNHNIFV
jgi:hypothetical protein